MAECSQERSFMGGRSPRDVVISCKTFENEQFMQIFMKAVRTVDPQLRKLPALPSL